jgi:predicted ATPase
MTLVGRAAEMLVLERELQRARERHGAFVIVSGEMGIGKTRLADEVSRRARDELVVAWGRSWEGEGTPAYWPFLQLLRALRAETPALFDEAVAASDELAALLSARKVATPVDPEQARFRLFDAVARLLRAISETKPVLLVLDDLHAADHASLGLLRFVARDLHGSRIAIVATARDLTDAPEAFAKVAREATTVPLGRLSREALKEWASSVGQATSADAVFERSEGNPLFANELLAAASKQPGGKQTPLGVREAIRAHLELAKDSANVLEAASVIGRDFTCDVLARLTGVPDARAALSSAVDAGIVVDLGEGQMRFAHILVRDELYAKTGARRAELHRKLADLSHDTAEIASHALAGARPEDAPRAIERVLVAMQDASGRLAFADAATLGARALATLASARSAGGDDEASFRDRGGHDVRR